jgi:3-dehydroquinate synthase
MTRITKPSPPVVVLTGFMGTGKSETGRALAGLLDVPFVDTDELIERGAGKKISDIFASDGEKKFRELEEQVCRDLAPDGGAVIATGGGTVVNDRNYGTLAALGTVVTLESTVNEIVERLENDSTRPLLAPGDDAPPRPLRETVKLLLDQRRPAYDRAEFAVRTSGRSPQEVAAVIRSRLGPGCRIVDVSVDVRPLPAPAGGGGRTETAPAVIRAADLDAGPRAGHAHASGSHCRIVIGRGAAAKIGNYLTDLGLSSRVFLFVPRHLTATLPGRIQLALEAAGIPDEVVPIDDGDNNKNLAQVRDLLDRMAVSRAGRDSVVVSVGGGVAGDLAGFVASIYMRGVPFVQVPTTLISQVDASIGGKVGVNHPRAKNLIGAIYQPALVLNDPLLLRGLPSREIANGMAEVVRTAIIGAPGLYRYLRETRDRDREQTLSDPAFLERCVFDCARIKAGVVEKDPYERDLRRVLNLGHTLGHALESALEYEDIKHGEAVAIGIIAAIRVAVSRGRAGEDFLRDTIEILKWCGLPAVAPRVDRKRLRRALKLDKKVKSGRLFFILPLGVGLTEIVDDVTEDELLSVL